MPCGANAAPSPGRSAASGSDLPTSAARRRERLSVGIALGCAILTPVPDSTDRRTADRHPSLDEPAGPLFAPHPVSFPPPPPRHPRRSAHRRGPPAVGLVAADPRRHRTLVRTHRRKGPQAALLDLVHRRAGVDTPRHPLDVRLQPPAGRLRWRSSHSAPASSALRHRPTVSPSGRSPSLRRLS